MRRGISFPDDSTWDRERIAAAGMLRCAPWSRNGGTIRMHCIHRGVKLPWADLYFFSSHAIWDVMAAYALSSLVSPCCRCRCL